MKLTEKKWIRHSDIHSLLRDGCKTQNEMVTICHKVNRLYENFRLYPILVNPSNVKKYLQTIEWNFHSSRPKIISLNRKDYLCRIVHKRHPHLQRIGDKYYDESGKKIANMDRRCILDAPTLSISIGLTELRDVLTSEKRVLFILVECFRYSERTLNELALKDDRQEHFYSDYCYSFSARSWDGCISSDKAMFSTITTIRGKALFKVAT
jgi:hypothetical protein